MTQPANTPAWGTPVPPSAPGPAVTQPMQAVLPVPQRMSTPESRVTALYYATRLTGEVGTGNPDVHLATTLRLAAKLEAYIYEGKIGV